MGEAYMIDYYDIYELDRSWTEKQLRKKLSTHQFQVKKLLGNVDPNNIEYREELLATAQELGEAIKILGNPTTRAQYDRDLDFAISSGTVRHDNEEKVKDILEQARKYMETQRYSLAIDLAKEALEADSNQPEPYEIISQSDYAMGNYAEAIDTVRNGAAAFANNITLRWLEAHYLVMIEDYNNAQALINNGLSDFNDDPIFLSEQVYLYYYAEKDKQGKKAIDSYINRYPNNNDLRKFIAYDLYDIAQQCYVYDSSAEMYLITEEDKYKRCLELLTQANQLYQDQYLLDALNEAKSFGNKEFDTDHKPLMIAYGVLGIAGLIFALFLFGNGASGMGMLSLILGAVFGLFAFLVYKISFRPIWKINRDYYRGFKESDDGALYTLLSWPLDLADTFADMFR